MEKKILDATWYNQASDEDKKVFREWVTEVLRTTSLVKVHFRKKDDSIRIMECTLMPNLLPVYEKKTERTKVVNEEVCSIYDLEKAEWRSFRFDTVTMVEFKL